MSIKRLQRISLPPNRSAFLWGPRKTGKTTLLREQFPDAYWINLLDYNLSLTLGRNPTQLREIVHGQPSRTVVIDEVQKVPQMMDEIHHLMEDEGYQFILSGSSARKLMRSGGNLLGGRAWRYELHPLVTAEIGEVDLSRILTAGLLPSHYLSPDSAMDLQAYVQDYLKEEIQAEAAVRNLPAFARFLETAAIGNGMLLNYSNAARECGVSVGTIRGYYRILDDTLIGREVPPWKKSMKRRLIETSKYYLFDVGVVSALLRHKTLVPGTTEFGRAFEQFIFQELWAYRHYSRKDFPIAFWRTASGSEVDFILGDAEVAIEVTSSTTAEGKTKGLHLFREEQTVGKSIVVARSPAVRATSSGVTIFPWREFCRRLWSGEVI